MILLIFGIWKIIPMNICTKQKTHRHREQTYGVSLVVQWIRIILPMHGTQIWSHPWSGKIPHALGQQNLCATTTEPIHLERVLHERRSPCSEKPVYHNEEYPCSLQLEKARVHQQRPRPAKDEWKENKLMVTNMEREGDKLGVWDTKLTDTKY